MDYLEQEEAWILFENQDDAYIQFRTVLQAKEVAINTEMQKSNHKRYTLNVVTLKCGSKPYKLCAIFTI